MDIQFLADIEKQLLVGLPLTLNLGILSLLGGGFLALFFNLIRVNPIGEAFVSAYVFLFRGTPLLIQIFLIYYGLAHFWVIRHTFLWPFFREPYWCGLLALVLNDAAYDGDYSWRPARRAKGPRRGRQSLRDDTAYGHPTHRAAHRLPPGPALLFKRGHFNAEIDRAGQHHHVDGGHRHRPCAGV